MTELQELLDGFFARYSGIAYPDDHHERLRAIAAGTSPTRDRPRDRWLVLDPDQVFHVLTSRDFGNDLFSAGHDTRSRRLLQRISPEPPSILFIEPPLHAKLRRPLSKRMRGSRISRLTELFAGSAAARLRSSARDHALFDLGLVVFPALAETTLAAFDLQGDLDPGQVVDDTFAINQLFDLECDAEAVAAGHAARRRLRSVLASSLERQAATGRDALGAEWARAVIPLETQISTLEFTIRAGVVTAGCLLLNAVYLIRHVPEFKDLLADDLDVDNGGIERLLVAAAPALDTGRIALKDVRVGDATIKKGETTICLLAAANEEWRERAEHERSHTIFGGGRHTCAGGPLVRAELAAFVQLLRGMPRLRVAKPPVLHATPSFRGIRELYVHAAER